MNRHATGALARLAGTVISAFAAFDVLQQPWRRIEAGLVAGTLDALGVRGVGGPYGARVLVTPARSAAFLASITPSCSALGAVVAFGAIAVFLLHGPVPRRAAAVAAAGLVAVVGNLVRITLAVMVGSRGGSHALVVFHDWVGTFLGLLAVLGAFTIFVFVLLPGDRQLLEARRAG